MLTARLTAALLGSAFLNLSMTTCRSPGDADKVPESQSSRSSVVRLEGVDTSQLSPREESRWSAHVSELLSPCDNVPVTLAQCVEEKRDCSGCTAAAQYLVAQVQEGKTQSQVNAAYKARFSPDTAIEIETMGSPSKGSPDAPITIVEWADFECPACRMASTVLNQFVNDNKDVRLVFKNYPLDIHENAETAARAALAADAQGKFWDMHNALFSSEVPLIESTLLQIAKSIVPDIEQFKKDLRSEKVADRVTLDRKQGEAAKLRATPTIFINGRLFDYATDLKAGLDDWVSLERKLVEKGSSGKPSADKAKP